LKEKKKQKLMKAGFEARGRARREKEREREVKQREEKKEEEEREVDLNGWARKMRQEQEVYHFSVCLDCLKHLLAGLDD
jgi:actin-related protein 5